MIKRRFLIVTSLLLLTTIVALAQDTQDGYYTGYIVRAEGDTLRGKLLKDNNYLNPESITFNANGSEQEYTYNNILSFYINELDLLFDAHTITLNKDSNPLVPITGDYTDVTETGKHFLLVIAKTADYGIYTFLDRTGVERIYFRRGDKIDELLFYKRYVNDGKKLLIEERRRYRVQLLGFLISCSKVKQDIDRAGYDRNTLRSILKKYAQCQGDDLIYAPKRSRVIAKLGLSLGIGTLTGASTDGTTTISERNNRFLNSEFQEGGWFEFGLALKIKTQRDSRFAYKAELKISDRSVTTQWNRPIPVLGVLSRVNYETKNTYLRLNLLTNINLSQWDGGAFFFEAGAYLNNTLSGSVEIDSGVFRGGDEYTITESGLDDPILDSEIGVTLGFGVEFDKIAASMRFNTALGDNVDVETGLGVRPNGFSLNLVYLF